MPPEAPTIALPPTILRALDGIAKDLTDMPRDCARDVQELCLWHARLARRLRTVLTMRVPVPDLGSNSKIVVAKLSDSHSKIGVSPKPLRRRVVRTPRPAAPQLEMLL